MGTHSFTVPNSFHQQCLLQFKNYKLHEELEGAYTLYFHFNQQKCIRDDESFNFILLQCYSNRFLIETKLWLRRWLQTWKFQTMMMKNWSRWTALPLGLDECLFSFSFSIHSTLNWVHLALFSLMTLKMASIHSQILLLFLIRYKKFLGGFYNDHIFSTPLQIGLID